MIGSGVNVSGVRYVVASTEITYGGIRSAPFFEVFVGRRARTRALAFASRERRGSTLQIQVYPEGGKRRKPLWTYCNDRPLCPCNNPRCESRWAAGRIYAPLDVLELIAPHEAKRRAPSLAVPIVGCAGLGLDRCAA